MRISASYKKHTLQFVRPAGTSRGTYLTKDSWFVFLSRDGITGIGECSLLKGLSIDDHPGFEDQLKSVCRAINQGDFDFDDPLHHFPAIRFGLETAMKDLENGGKRLIFHSDFYERGTGIVTNGLIWMGNQVFMEQQIAEKIEKGFSCIKLKIGALNKETEIGIIKRLRSSFPVGQLTIRVDANGAYQMDEVFPVLDELAKLEVHSIEQPIAQGNWDAMARVCALSPIPVALDEELIGAGPIERKQQLIGSIKPQFLILKPGLLGGFAASDEWVWLAKEHGIGWWATSALESNIGLNAIAQWVATKNNPLPQGLGTGMLFSNNIASPLAMSGEKLFYDQLLRWDKTTEE
jgi:o-succinylbenzoate synthase